MLLWKKLSEKQKQCSLIKKNSIGGELIRRQNHVEKAFNSIRRNKKRVYSGIEYTVDDFIVRVVDANLVENFEDFVVQLNKFSIFDYFIRPATFQEYSTTEKRGLPDSRCLEIKFRSNPMNRVLKVLENNIEKEDLDQFVQNTVNYLLGVEKGIYPPLGFYSLEDVFFYGGLFFFLPPQVISNKELKYVLDNYGGKHIYYAPEFLTSNVCDFKTTLYVMGKIIEFFIKNAKLENDKQNYNNYDNLVKNLTAESPSERTLPKEIVNNLPPFKTFSMEHFDEISEKILQEIMKDKRKFITAQIPLDYRSFNILTYFLHERISNNSAFIYVGNDLVNVPRVILNKYKKYLEYEESKIMVQTLYSNVKFNTLLPILLSFIEKVENVFFVVNDMLDAHHFIRTYLSHIKVSDYETKIVILTRRAYNDEAKLDLSQFFMREYLQYVDSYLDLCRNTEPQSKQDKIIENLSYNTKILTVLGQKFTHNELVILENILGINIEPCLKDLINNKIVSFEANEYYFEKNLWQKIYQVFPDEKRKLHLKLAKKLEEIRDPFNENLSKAAFHYEMSGRSLHAVILYIKFVRRNLDSYVFSIEKMKEALKNAYNILKRYDRLNSIAWNNTVIKFFYQTLEKIPEYTFIDVLSNFEKGNIPRKLKTLLSLYAYYIGEEYSKVIQLYSQTFTDTLSTLDFSNLYTKDFMWLKAYLIYQRAHYSLDDTLKDLDNFKAISDEIPEKNETWSNLKAEYMLLYGMAMNYKKPKEAKRYLDKAKQIISELRIRHLEISLENAYGILNDSSALSISCFKNAIQIASEICYIKRSVVPTINLLRSLLYFGFFDELKKEIKKVEHILDISDNVSDITFFYRILSFAPMYEGNYIAAVSLISKSLELEKKYKLQQSSLRALVLNELMNGSFEKARNIIEDNLENPALKTRAFEYLLNLVLNYDNNEKFKETWLNYKNSQYNLLREEILYIFAEKIAYVDESGFLSEIKRWESFYTAANINLSLLYVLLAKYKYFNYKELQIKSAVLENEICKLANSMGSFSHPLIEKCFKNLGKDRKRQDQKVKENLEDALEELLHVFKRLDSDISIEHFVELFASQIYRIFKPEKFLISINDKLTGLEYEISNTDELPDSELLILHPFEVFVKDYIDSKASYKIYIYSEQIKLSGTSTSVFLSTVTLIEELFSGQLKGLISRERSNIDSLTGLYNRWRFNYLLNQKMEDKSKVFSVFLLDIDDFKKVNDTYGHAFGDRVLKSIADSIKKIVVLESKGKEDNFVARYGGEEFIGVINGSMLEAYEICEDLRKYVENNSAALLGFKITVSIGIAESAEKENMTELIGLADQRLYAVKNSGKNRVEIG